MSALQGVFRMMSLSIGNHVFGTLPGTPSDEVREFGEHLARKFQIKEFDVSQVPIRDFRGPRVLLIVALPTLELVGSPEARPLVLRPRYDMSDEELIAAAVARAEGLGVLNPTVRIADGRVEVFEG